MKIVKIDVEADDGTRGSVILDESGPLSDQLGGDGYWLVWDESDPQFENKRYREEFIQHYPAMFDKLITYYDELRELMEFIEEADSKS